MSKTNLASILLILIALLLQGWLSIVRLATDNLTPLSMFIFSTSIILLITGTVLFASSNIHSLFAINHRINYAITIVSLAGLCLLIIFRISLANILFPRTMILNFLIVDFFWLFFLGLLLDRFRVSSDKKSAN